MNVKKLDHVGLTVRDLDKTIAALERVLGVKAFGREDRPDDRVRLGFVPLGDTALQLLEHWGEAHSAVGRWFREQGPGSPHIALEVEDLRAEIVALRAAGVPLLGNPPDPGARGSVTAFIDPLATNGLLTELVEHQKIDTKKG
jgi:methylmalonyl-CoA/ethylmalonyl-CoA epimerase